MTFTMPVFGITDRVYFAPQNNLKNPLKGSTSREKDKIMMDDDIIFDDSECFPVSDDGAPDLNLQDGTTAWVNEIRPYGNFFYYETCFRLLANACRNYNGPFFDRDVFLPVARMIHPSRLSAIVASCSPKQVRITSRDSLEEEEEEERRHRSLPGDAREVMRMLWNDPKRHAAFAVMLKEWFPHAIEAVRGWESEKPDPQRRRFEEIVSLFELNAKERNLLVMASMISTRVWPVQELKGTTSGDKVVRVSALLDISESEYMEMVRSRGKLRRFGCLGNEGDLHEEMAPFINGMDEHPIMNRFFRPCAEEALPWSYFGALGEKHGEFLKNLLRGRDKGRGLNILLYGEPGTGKTSFAQALAKEAGLTAYSIAHCFHNQRNGPVRTVRFAAVQICNSRVDPGKSLIIIDEADELLEGGRSMLMSFNDSDASVGKDKGLLNEVLDTVRTPCIWITNSSSNLLDPSNCRRFDYSIKFNRLSQPQRTAIWNNARSKFGLEPVLTAELVNRLAQRYEVSAGGVSLAVQNLQSMLQNMVVAEKDAEQVLCRLLRSHCRLLHIETDTKEKAGVSGDYSLEGLNIKGPIKAERIVKALKRFQEEQRKEQQPGKDRPRMNILLSGEPGTGKTEFVKYLGNALGMPVVTRMGSDLLDKYVGGTEKNIRKAFQQAASEKAILFLDEIDGLLQSRERAERSWEVTQVNELLHRMETFEGILIGATNFVNNLDPATLRRFTYKLEFDCLDDAGKVLFFKRMFAGVNPSELSSDDEKRLQRIPRLTPGDYRTVRQSLYYLGDDVTTQQLLEGLERECAMKAQGRTTKNIGF
jgi:SpoVK/Ycf46/Vps4 family AAA+-type ATPase